MPRTPSKAQQIKEAILFENLAEIETLISKDNVNELYTTSSGIDFYPFEHAIEFGKYKAADFLLLLGANKNLYRSINPLLAKLSEFTSDADVTNRGQTIKTLKDIGLNLDLQTLCETLKPLEGEDKFSHHRLYLLTAHYKDQIKNLMASSSEPLCMALDLYEYKNNEIDCFLKLLEIENNTTHPSEGIDRKAVALKLLQKYKAGKFDIIAKAAHAICWNEPSNIFEQISTTLNDHIASEPRDIPVVRKFLTFINNIKLSIINGTSIDIIIKNVSKINDTELPFSVNLLYQAIARRDIDFIKQSVTKENINTLVDSDECKSMPLLHHAIKLNRAEIVEHLCKIGANTELAVEDCQSALIYAIKLERIECVEALLANGAKINPIINGIETSEAISRAIDCDEYKTVLNTLLKHPGLNINLLDSHGFLPIIKTIKQDRTLLFISLLNKGPDIFAREADRSNLFDVLVTTRSKSEIAYYAIMLNTKAKASERIHEAFREAEEKCGATNNLEQAAIKLARMNDEMARKHEELKLANQQLETLKRKIAETEEQYRATTIQQLRSFSNPTPTTIAAHDIASEIPAPIVSEPQEDSSTITTSQALGSTAPDSQVMSSNSTSPSTNPDEENVQPGAKRPRIGRYTQMVTKPSSMTSPSVFAL